MVDYFTMATDWKANVVRVPLNQDCWLSDPSNPSYDPTYEATVDQQVQWAEQFNMDIILDLHWSDKGTYSVGQACLAASINSGNGSCQQAMADAHSLTFWQQVAAKYKSDPHVIFELYNEPFVGRGPNPNSASWQLWLNGGVDSADGFTIVGMQALYNAVRAAGANNLVIAGGLYWANDVSGVTTYPIQGTNIAYAAHVYETGTSALPTIATASQSVPIIITEFGDGSGSCATATDTSVTQFANKQGGNAPAVELSWTAWAFYAASTPCTFPSLIADSTVYAPTAEGAIVKAALLAGP